jgi:alcohol dehydrogenase
MLPHVVRWNQEVVDDRYGELRPDLASFLDDLARTGALPATLRQLGVANDALPELAADAATQWTGTFNPRRFDAAAALYLYTQAY